MTGSGGDGLLLLWTRLGRALAPFGVPVGREVLALWRDQAVHGLGPLVAAGDGQRRAVEDLIAALRALAGAEDAQAGQDAAHAGER